MINRRVLCPYDTNCYGFKFGYFMNVTFYYVLNILGVVRAQHPTALI